MLKCENNIIKITGEKNTILKELEHLIHSFILNFGEVPILKVIIESFKEKENVDYIECENQEIENIIKELKALKVPNELQKRILKDFLD